MTMSRAVLTRHLPPIAAFLLATILAGPSRGLAAPPNILFLMTDQQRGDCLGAAGNTAIHTPNLDRLATEGVRFANAYSSTPSCTPARSAILTGLSPWHHGMLGYGRIAEHYPRELPALLRAAGYYTLGIGKMHYSPQRALHGFHRTILDEAGVEDSPEFRSDYRAWFWSQVPTLMPEATGLNWNDFRAKAYVLPERLHPTRWTGDVAVNFLETYSGDKPFFLTVSFHRPHSPYDPPERILKRYANAEMPPAAIGDWDEAYARDSNPKAASPWRGEFGPDQVRASRRAYYASVTFVDEQIGRILDALTKRGWLDNTLILFTSDHGDMLGDHHLWRKTYAFEGSAKIPMLMRWPESLTAARGQTLPQPVELRDVLPTFLDAAGAQYTPADFDGRSMLQLVRGQTDDWRPWIDLEHAQCYGGAGSWTALTDGREKYIFYVPDGRQLLFDLTTDPGERHNLANDTAHADALQRWRQRMSEHLAERGEPFVKNGELVADRPHVLYSPRYPIDEETPAAPPARPRGRSRGS